METPSTDILILEDDALAAAELKECLSGEGLLATIARTRKQFEKMVERHEYQLLIIDIGLPDGSGLDVIRMVREESEVAIIVISGHTEESDVVAALELGADDYLKKPISIRELRAKIRRLLVRTGRIGYSKNLCRSNKHEFKYFGDWKLDVDNHRLFYRSDSEVELTTAEYRLLLALVENSDRILSRRSLLNHLHGESGPYDERTVDGLISRVRQKFSKPDSYQPIKTIRNAGYMFSDSVRTVHQDAIRISDS
ncbi:MAG: response regulator transcription factor [Halieaceae bacterium]